MSFDYDLMDIQVELLAYSQNTITEDKLATWLIRMPKYLLAELNTHRLLSRNAASSRAIPCKRMRSYAKYTPVFMQNCPGMQSYDYLPVWKELIATSLHWWQKQTSLFTHWCFEKLGVHKQQANRYIENHCFVDVIVSATELENFFKLRCDNAADLNFQYVANLMRRDCECTKPTPLQPGEWHIPLLPGSNLNTLTEDERLRTGEESFRKRAVAQLARISYMNHGKKGEVATLADDLKTYAKLAESDPKHLSPLEHVAEATFICGYVGNFKGFIQMRKTITNEDGRY